MNRVPPHDHQLEQAVLGALLFDPTQALPPVEPEHFYWSGHRLTYETIVALRARGETADLVTVTAELMRRGMSEKAGGAAYLSGLTSGVVPRALEQHAERLTDLWRLRQAINRAREIESAAFDAPNAAAISSRFSQAAAELAPQSKRMVPADRALRETVAGIEAAWGGKGHPGFPLGYLDVDSQLHVGPGDLVVVAGRPGMGKSAFGIGASARAALNGQRVVYFSLEMSRDALWKRALSDRAGVPLEVVRSGRLRDDQWPRLTRAMGELSDCHLWIDDTPAAGIGYVESQSQRIRDEHGVDLVVVDHLHRMREKGRYTAQREMYDEILVRAKNLAKSLECGLLMLAQLNRGVEDRSPPRPFLSDLRETGRIEEEADAVLMLYRPEYYLREKCPHDERGLGYLQVEKQREGRSGFDVRLAWSEDHAAYRDLAR